MTDNPAVPSLGEEENVTLEMVVERAMQKYWDDWCSDTGCVPPEFTIRGPGTTRVYADFRSSEMALRIVEAATYFLASVDA